MSYNETKKEDVFNKIIQLCNDKKLCEETLKILFKYEGYHDDYNDEYYNKVIDKLEDVLYSIEPYINQKNDNYDKLFNVENVVISLLNAFVDYEYFNYHHKVGNIQDENHYDYKIIEKKYDYMVRFMQTPNDCKFKTPMSPNTTYSYVMHVLLV